MARPSLSANPLYDALASPFRSIGAFAEANEAALLREEAEALDGTIFRPLGRVPYQRGSQILKVGSLDQIGRAHV